MRTQEEETINAYSHLLWCIGSFAILIGFLIDSSIAIKLKSSALIMLGLSSWTFFSSFLYHVTNEKKKMYNREIDKTSIYLMITGCGVAINMATVDTLVASISCSVLLVLGSILLGIYTKNKTESEVFSLTSYILLGWLCIVPITGILGDNLYQEEINMHLIILGGILYSAGIFYYARDSIKWNHTKWHLFVMGGYCAHVFALYRVIHISSV